MYITISRYLELSICVLFKGKVKGAQFFKIPCLSVLFGLASAAAVIAIDIHKMYVLL